MEFIEIWLAISYSNFTTKTQKPTAKPPAKRKIKKYGFDMEKI